MAWLISVVASGVLGLLVGAWFWSHFFWVEERPMAWLSPTGELLTLGTGLGFSVIGGSVTFAFLRRYWQSSKGRDS